MIRAANPAAVADLAELERAIEYAEPTIDKAALEIQRTLAMGVGDFASAVEVEAAADPVKKEIVASPPVASSPVAEPKMSPEMEALWKEFDKMMATG